jgi:hypothetical protein
VRLGKIRFDRDRLAVTRDRLVQLALRQQLISEVAVMNRAKRKFAATVLVSFAAAAGAWFVAAGLYGLDLRSPDPNRLC